MAPDYDYRCVHCGHHFAKAQKMCPDCLCRTLTRRNMGPEPPEPPYVPRFIVLEG